MTIGKTLWVIILCKVFVLFFVLKIFFFPNRLNALPDDAAKGACVATDLVHRLPEAASAENLSSPVAGSPASALGLATPAAECAAPPSGHPEP